MESQQRVAREMIASSTNSHHEHHNAQRPKIINIGSMSAYTVSLKLGDYCISKAGIAMMTKLFAARLAEHGIGVFEVRPGIIATDMTTGQKEAYDARLQLIALLHGGNHQCGRRVAHTKAVNVAKPPANFESKQTGSLIQGTNTKPSKGSRPKFREMLQSLGLECRPP